MMEFRPDTSSSGGQFRGQWSFLANPSQHGSRSPSLPPSSYILQSDRSSLSPLPAVLHHHTANGSRSSLPRNLTAVSVGGRSSATIPSQPVLIRVHSADASAHTHPAPRPRRPIKMSSKASGLPAVSEFSIRGILAAIQEDVESDINTISEILGRSRLILADQHDSHMPPQGEIRAMPSPLQAVEEIDGIFEDMPPDDVLILREDASLLDGSHAGSAAYGLLERLQAMPRNTRVRGEWMASDAFQPPTFTTRSVSSPAALPQSPPNDAGTLSPNNVRRGARVLLQSVPTLDTSLRTTAAVVSETHLSAEAVTVVALDTSQPHAELGGQPFNRDLHTYMVEDDAHNAPYSLRDRMQNFLYVSDPTGLSTWLQGQTHTDAGRTQGAAGHLRDLLQR